MKRREVLFALAGTSTVFLLPSCTRVPTNRAPMSRTLEPEKFGAAGTGARSDEAAFSALLAAVHEGGGNAIIRCRPSATYPITADKVINASNVILEGMGCTFTGGGRWIVNGDPGVAGGAPKVRNVHLRNFRLAAVGRFNPSRGPRFNWVEDSTLSDITKVGATGTYFNFHMARNCHASRLVGIGSRGGFGFLMYHCRDCTLSDSSFTDDNGAGTHPIVVQVKGGQGNHVRRVTASGIRGRKVRAVFYCRGDAPYKPAPDLGTYPYANAKTWRQADPDRQTRGATWEDCIAKDCGGSNAFLIQESTTSEFVRCASIRSGAFHVVSVAAGLEGGIRFRNCRSENAHGAAFIITGNRDNWTRGIELEGIDITGAGKEGMRLQYLSAPRLSNITIRGSGSDGLTIEDCDSPRLVDVEVRRH